MVTKPPQPRDVTLLSANLLAGTVGVAGLGVGPGNRERPLPAPCTEPWRDIEGWEARHGGPSPVPGWGHKTKAQPSVWVSLMPFDHRPQRSLNILNVSLLGRMTGRPSPRAPGLRTGPALVNLGKLTPRPGGCTNY